MRLRSTRRLLLAAALLAVPRRAPNALASQQSPGAVLEITVMDGATGRPIPGAQVVVPEVASVRTDSVGWGRLVGLSPVNLTIEIHAVGYDARLLTLDLVPGKTSYLSVPIEVLPVLLPEVRVEGREELAAPRSRELQEFYQRVRTGTGQYLTRDDIERRNARDLSDLFGTLPGISLIGTNAGDRVTMASKPSAVGDLLNPDDKECAIQYFLDGSPIRPIHGGVIGAEVALYEIEGIEIYRRGSGVPAKFHRLHNNCGVILIWKKERR